MVIPSTLRTLSLFVLAVFLLALTSCGGSSNSSPPAPEDITSIVVDVDSFGMLIARAEILKATADRDRQSVQRTLLDLKFGLLRLGQPNPSEKDVLFVFRALKRLSGISLAEVDRERLAPLTLRIATVVGRVAEALNLKLESFTWGLFTYSFSGGLTPFTSFGDLPWKTDWALEESSYASVTGWGKAAWLVSPSFDLSHVQSPSVRLVHSISVNRNTGSAATDPFNRLQILSEAFKIKVSTNYPGGNPEQPGVVWTDLNLGAMPASYDFHKVESPEIDLSAYRGANVTLALFMKVDDARLGRHYVGWQIYKFELLGQGDLGSWQEREHNLFEFSFNSDKLAPFQSIDTLIAVDPKKGGANWEPFKRRDKWTYAKIRSHRNNPSDTWLVSPLIQLRAVASPQLMLRETVRNPTWNGLQAFASESYRGGPIQIAEWQPLPRPSQTAVRTDEWTDLSGGPFDLSGFVGKDIVIAFRFLDSGPPGDRTWEIESLTIRGRGEDILWTPLTTNSTQKP